MTTANAELARPTAHLNLRWTMAQMDKIMQLARKGYGAGDIAAAVGATPLEILQLGESNAFLVRRDRGVPGLPVLSIQRGSP